MLLGDAGTDKPTDPSYYLPSLVFKDLIDILDAEGIQQSLVIGHDWCVFALHALIQYRLFNPFQGDLALQPDSPIFFLIVSLRSRF